MGLTTWKCDRVHKSDVVVAKNYLTKPEISELNRLTTMFLDFAEDRARRRQATLMAEWVTQTDRFLDFNERTLLSGSGNVSASQLKQVAAETLHRVRSAPPGSETERAAAEELDDLRALT